MLRHQLIKVLVDCTAEVLWKQLIISIKGWLLIKGISI